MHTQVAIVGGGPVGLGLAIDLGQRGVSVVVVERRRDVHEIPKGQNLTQRSMEHFKLWEVEDRIRAARMMPPGYPSVGINAWGDLMSGYAHPWFRRGRVDDYYFTRNERLPQYRTEEVLRSRIAELPNVTALYGSEAAGVDRDDAEATVATADGDVIAAEYVVGCDGSHSMVRRCVGIGESRSGHDRRMALLVFRSRGLHELVERRFGEASFFNILHPDLDGYWRFLGRVDVGERWFFHAPVEPDADLEHFDHRALLRGAIGAEFDVDIDHIGFWDLRIAVADTYRSGRVFLAGDAAHSHPPYGGYGINTGLEDARNLGWKLAGVIDGWGGAELLDSYTAERRPVFLSTAADFIERFIEDDRAFIAAHDPDRDRADFEEAWEQRRSGSDLGVSEFEPHYEGSPIVHGSPGSVSSAVGTHTFRARSGHHLPPPLGSSPEACFSALGGGFSLLTADPADPIVDAFSGGAQHLGLPLAILTVDMERYGTPHVLLRPDHFVGWIGDGAHIEPMTVLARAVGR